MLRQAYGDEVLSRKHTNGKNVFKAEELQQMTITDLTDFQLRETKLLLPR
jgi:hypothetical protein